ncbi:MAG: SpoIIE family protein phosphatase [Phycisphaerae bacterium]
MRIRWKLMLLLLVIAVVPLGVVGFLTTRATVELRSALAERATISLTQMARNQLQNVVDEQCRAIRRDADMIEFALRVQAREIERCLNTGSQTADFLIASDAPPPAELLALLQSSPRYEPLRVSFAMPVVWAARDGVFDRPLDELAGMLACSQVYPFLERATTTNLLWRHTTFASGVQVRYPAVLEVPRERDPRLEPWYGEAIAATEPRWVAPLIDPITGQSMLTAAMPIREPDGRVGVTAIDLSVDELMRRVRLPLAWTPHAECLIVQPVGVLERANPSLSMVARKPRGEGANSQSEKLDMRSLDQSEFDLMLQNMGQNQAGVRRMDFHGRECMWAYSPVLREGSYLLVIVPVDATSAPVQFAETFIGQMVTQQLIMLGIAVAVIVCMVALVALLASRSVTRPINALTETARRVAAGDLDARADVRRSDEIGQLGRTLNEMVPQLRDSLKLREALALAQEVQQHLLPSIAPRVAGFDLSGRSLYCDQTGGDYFDFLELSGGDGGVQVGIVVADVTGHGAAAALLMATVRAAIRSRADRAGDLGALVTEINRVLAVGTPEDRFVTLYLLAIDADRRVLRWVSAGHEAAIRYDAASGSVRDLSGRDLALAIDGAWSYGECGPETLQVGDVILIGTDGIWETRDARRDMYGKERLERVLQRTAGRGADDILDAVFSDIAAFRGDADQLDDVTLVVVKCADARIQ